MVYKTSFIFSSMISRYILSFFKNIKIFFFWCLIEIKVSSLMSLADYLRTILGTKFQVFV